MIAVKVLKFHSSLLRILQLRPLLFCSAIITTRLEVTIRVFGSLVVVKNGLIHLFV